MDAGVRLSSEYTSQPAAVSVSGLSSLSLTATSADADTDMDATALVGDDWGGWSADRVHYDVCLHLSVIVATPADNAPNRGKAKAKGAADSPAGAPRVLRDGSHGAARAHEALRTRWAIYAACRAAGLQLRALLAPDGDSLFVLVGAREKQLEDLAESVSMEKRLDSRFADPDAPKADAGRSGYIDFRASKRNLFEPGFDAFLSSLERQRLVFRLLEGDPAGRTRVVGAGLDLDGLVATDVLISYFPLAHPRWVRLLHASWLRRGLGPPPVHDIRDYFGERVAFYFAWASLYTRWLGGLAVLSICAAGAQVAVGVDNVGLPAYCTCVTLWSAAFAEAWRRREHELRFLWNAADFAEEEATRPEFLRAKLPGGKGLPVARGIFSDRGLVAVDGDETAPEVAYFPHDIRRRRWLCSLAATLFLVCFLGVAAGAVAALKLVLALTPSTSQTVGGGAFLPEVNAAALIAGAANAVLIQAMSLFWTWAGARLSDLETHRTDSAYEDSLIVKTFAFQFANNFSSLFYIAFVQGAELHLFGLREPDGEEPLVDRCAGGDCLTALAVQLAVLILGKHLARQVLLAWRLVRAACDPASLLPWRKGQGAGSLDHLPLSEQLRRQAALPKHEGTVAEFSEMVTQFGYVTLFAAAFPAGACLSWFNNLLEERTDALKLVYTCQRPRYRGASGVGTWGAIIDLMAGAAVVTNCLILFLSSKAMGEDLHRALGSREAVLLVVVGVEHLLFALRWALSVAVRDEPAWVDRQRVRLEGKLFNYKLTHKQLFVSDRASEGHHGNDVDFDDEAGLPAAARV